MKYKSFLLALVLPRKPKPMKSSLMGLSPEVLTFAELEQWFADAHINLAELVPEAYDALDTNWGRSFPIAGGLLRTAD